MMKRALLVVTGLLVLTACDSEVETWQGDLLAQGWNDFYDSRDSLNKYARYREPEGRVTHSSLERCDKGITALENQWQDYLADLSAMVQERLEEIRAQQQDLFGLDNPPQEWLTEEQAKAGVKKIEEGLEDPQVREKRDQLSEQEQAAVRLREAITKIGNTMNGECRLVHYSETWTSAIAHWLDVLKERIEEL